MTPGWVAIGTLAVALIGAVALLVRLLPEIRHLRATTHQATVDSAIAEDAAGDARWVALIEQQTKSLLDPLTRKVEAQERRIDHLEQEIRSTRRLLRRTLDTLLAYVRHVAILAGLLNAASIPHPAPPPIPADIHDEL